MYSDNPLIQRYIAMHREAHATALGRLRVLSVSSDDPELVACEEAWKIREQHTGSGESGDHDQRPRYGVFG